MQQVETGSRFWWRVLDAHSPEPVTSPAPPPPAPQPPQQQRSYAPMEAPPRKPAKAAANPYALEIPRSDRRSRRRPSKRLGWQTAALMTVTVVVAGAAATIFAMPGTIERLHIAETVAAWKGQALVAAGFGIAQVSVSGQRYTADADVFDALDLTNVKTFADLDAPAAVRRIERLPWVETAQITRVYPSAMSIQIRERAPYAQWRRQDRSFLIDATGRVLGPIATNQSWNLPVVAGEGANAEAALLLTALSRCTDIARQFAYGERVAARRWAVVLKNGSRIELGAERDDEGLAQIARNFELRRALTGAPMIVDVRTPGRIAVRPLAGAPTAALVPANAGQVAAMTAEAR